MNLLHDFARAGYQRAKRSPLLRRLLRMPAVTRMKAAAASWLAVGDARYDAWRTERLRARSLEYGQPSVPGLLSFLTTVWNTPVPFFSVLTESLLQQTSRDFEWVVLDNGTTDPATLAYLQNVVRRDPRVTYLRVDENQGIVGGMKLCLGQARGRYIVPVDSDDFLYPDAVAILTAWILRENSPPLLYSDEDHLLGQRAFLPYFKPDWDPVLLLNSAYIAHLCAIDRARALELNVYGHRDADGCHDWDTFLKFMAAGLTPVHVSEVLYSWRMHARSTASNVNSKSYIHQSHRAVLERYIATQPQPQRYELAYSPLFEGTPDWWIRRRRIEPRNLLSLVICDQLPSDAPAKWQAAANYPSHQAIAVSAQSTADELLSHLMAAQPGSLVCLVSEHVRSANDEWPWEALGLLERLPDAAIVGGRLSDRKGVILDAGRYFGVQGDCGCPDTGRSIEDRGYFAQMWKQRSVDAVSPEFAVYDGRFLSEVLEGFRGQALSLETIGLLTAARARATGCRVIYSPFAHGTRNAALRTASPSLEQHLPLETRGTVSRGPHYYSRHLGREPRTAYQPASLQRY